MFKLYKIKRMREIKVNIYIYCLKNTTEFANGIQYFSLDEIFLFKFFYLFGPLIVGNDLVL